MSYAKVEQSSLATAALAMRSALACLPMPKIGKSSASLAGSAFGKAYEIERGHVYWVGEFNGTFFNDKGKGSLFDRAAVKCPAY